MDIVESTVKPVENTESSEKTLRFDCEYLLNASQYDRYLENIEKKTPKIIMTVDQSKKTLNFIEKEYYTLQRGC